ncbi:MAG: MMPL family transporter [Deltaproteobacteria bacterium]|nr:MMPL family transporter [Deltaproteobacteria bacterium]
MATFWERYSRVAWKYAWGFVILGMTCAVLTTLAVRRLGIDSDFKRMLPRSYPSVQELEEIEQRFRSTANLLLLIGGGNMADGAAGPDWPTMRRFIDDFAAAAPERLRELVDRVEYNTKPIDDFTEKYRYLYIDLPDLHEIEKRLDRQIRYEKLKKNPFFVDIDDPPNFDITDIEGKYRHTSKEPGKNRDGYFTNAEATLAIVVLKPKAGSLNVADAKRLIAAARALVDKLHPEQYGVGLRIGFGGRYPKMITEYETIVGDAQHTLLLCALLVGSTVLLYFRKFRMCFLMIGAAGLGTLAALTFARYTIGYLTSQTAFLGSIILGNGINYGLILMARYLEERRERAHPPIGAMAIAMHQTWRGTFASCATTVFSFLALAVAQVRGFNQFGVIGSIGMVGCWLATYGLLPGWIHCTERMWPLRFRANARTPFALFMNPLARLATQRWRPVLISAACLAATSLVVAGWYIPDSLEYDFNKLRFKPQEQQESWEKWAQSHADDVFGESASPAVILADDLADVQPICDAIHAKAANLYTEAGHRIFDQCKTLFSFIPEQQEDKLAALQRIRKLLTGNTLKFLTDAQREKVDEFERTVDLQPVKIKDLPVTVIEKFRELDGRTGLVIYVYPTSSANLWDGRELVKFAGLLSRIELASGKIIYASGEAVIFSDLLNVVTREGPRVSLLALALVVFVVWLTFRDRFAVTKVLASLCLGIIWLIACLPLFRVKLNFLNFVALPIAFGIGVDYAVNIFQRYRQDGPGSMRTAVQQVGGAVCLCSLTTILGYGVLMISRNGALQTFGLTGLLAEITCLLTAVVVLPAYVTWIELEQKVMGNSNHIPSASSLARP